MLKSKMLSNRKLHSNHGNGLQKRKCTRKVCWSDILIGFVVIRLCSVRAEFESAVRCIFGCDGYFLMRLKISFKEYY